MALEKLGIRAVLLDLDGTLRDTGDIIYNSIQSAIETQTGKLYSRAEMDPYIHHHREVYRGLVGDDGLEEFDEVYSTLIDEKIPKAPLYEGADELVRQLHAAGYRLALVSSAKTGQQYLASHGLHEHFETIVGAQDVTALKPDPEPVLVALDRLGITAEEAVMVGDLPADMQASEAAGVPYRIGITHGMGSQEQLQMASATHIIDTLKQLPGLIENL